MYEKAKILMEMGNVASAAVLLCDVVAHAMGEGAYEPLQRDTCRKALLRLHKWMRCSDAAAAQIAPLVRGHRLQAMLPFQPAALLIPQWVLAGEAAEDNQGICRWLLEQAVTLFPDDRTALAAYGSWCHRQVSEGQRRVCAAC